VNFFADTTNLMLLALAALSGGLLAWPVLMRNANGLDPTQVTQLINRRHALIIDIRAPEAFAAGHVPQAKHIALDTLASKAPQLGRNKATPVVVICQTGLRSQRACATIRTAGYAEVFNLEGGILAWQKAGLPLVKR
jgi:rhodanese-related sulfurtransferase